MTGDVFVIMVLYAMIGPTSPAVPIPEPMALFVIFNTTVEIGPRIALVMIVGSQINGFAQYWELAA